MKTETKVKLWLIGIGLTGWMIYYSYDDYRYCKAEEQKKWEETYGRYEILDKKRGFVKSDFAPSADWSHKVIPDTVVIKKIKYIVTEIGNGTFLYSGGNIELPNTTRRIHTSAFYKCYNITSVS